MVIATLSVLTIFFFPAMQGPYSVVHGPVTALLSIRAAAGLRRAMVRATLDAVRSRLTLARFATAPFFRTAVAALGVPTAGFVPGSDSMLRC